MTDKLAPRLFFVLVGATCAALLWFLVPFLIQQYFPDNTEYYYFSENPVKVNKPNYFPCDAVVGNVRRISRVSTEGTFYRDLVLYRKVGDGVETIDVYSAKSVSPIVEGDVSSTLVLTLPCDLEPGIYYWRGEVVYSVKGLDRSYSYETEKFTVEKTPTPTPTEVVE